MRTYIYRCSKCKTVGFSRVKLTVVSICGGGCGGTLVYEGPTTERVPLPKRSTEKP